MSLYNHFVLFSVLFGALGLRLAIFFGFLGFLGLDQIFQLVG
jgi:hypothetical protein